VGVPDHHQILLSEKGSLKEAAKHLFAAMRTLDETDVDYIIAVRVPDVGLGRAINDRLKRAAA
jgi:L-threonylcarbamoyladenylate synthase